MDRALRAIIDAKYDKCVARAVSRMRRMPARDWDSSDSRMRTLWDHWKREMQDEHSVFHHLIEDMVEGIVHDVVNSLPPEDGALMTLDTDAMDVVDETPAEMVFAHDAVAAELLDRLNSRGCDEPHRKEVQRLLDAQSQDRFVRDIEPYR